MNACGTVSVFVRPSTPRTNSCCSAMYSRNRRRHGNAGLEQLRDILVRFACRLPGGLSYARPSIEQTCGRLFSTAGTSTMGTPATSFVGMISSVRITAHSGAESGWVAATDVFAALAPAAAFVEQPERLADAGCVPQEDLELAALLGPLGGLHLAKQRLGIARVLDGHVITTAYPGARRCPR